jgi:hypothetical protein
MKKVSPIFFLIGLALESFGQSGLGFGFDRLDLSTGFNYPVANFSTNLWSPWRTYVATANNLVISNNGGAFFTMDGSFKRFAFNGASDGVTFNIATEGAGGDGIKLTTSSPTHTWQAGDSVYIYFGDGSVDYISHPFSTAGVMQFFNGIQFENNAGQHRPLVVGVQSPTTVAIGGDITASSSAGAGLIVTGSGANGNGNSATNFTFISALGSIVKSNSMAAIEALKSAMVPGDTLDFSSNGVRYGLSKSPSGVLTTNKIYP